MFRSPFPSHRRYSITHRAVQRLRELVTSEDHALDDESLRDRLDGAIVEAEAESKAVRTMDVMLGEPQTLVPIERFGETLYAIVKDETVVTVLPKSHGEEILQRSQSVDQARPDATTDRFRRRWVREYNRPVPVERVSHISLGRSELVRGPIEAAALETGRYPQAFIKSQTPLNQEAYTPTQFHDPVTRALQTALDIGRRRAAVTALAEALSQEATEHSLLPLWNQLAREEIPQVFTIGDLVEAVQLANRSLSK